MGERARGGEGEDAGAGEEVTREESQSSYFAALKEKLRKGAEEHGERSFELSGSRLIEELQAECLDLAGWGWILWDKLQRLKRKVQQAEREAGHL